MNHVECIYEAERAVALLQPLRLRILDEARVPISASRIAECLGEPRQKVNYHVRELARFRFLEPAGSLRRRNLIEQNYVARAKFFVISPEILESLGADWRSGADQQSAARLLGLTAQVQRDLARAGREAADQNKRLPTWSLHSELRFESSAKRAAFAREVESAVARAIQRHAAPIESTRGRPYRLVAGCHPIPPENPDKERKHIS
ncbi:MAG: helix-turn-helix domain-containing protein [Thermoanaerobaculia bacterium]|nr:helix-turn-helix domain-containing protein [Thermoanaerobaculia bacterium]